jgi:hypothetical protein
MSKNSYVLFYLKNELIKPTLRQGNSIQCFLRNQEGTRTLCFLRTFPRTSNPGWGVEICKPTHDHPYVSFLLSSALHHCKYNLTCAAVHEFSEILTAVTVNYRSRVTAVAGAGFEPTSSGYEPAENTIFSTPLFYFFRFFLLASVFTNVIQPCN